MMSQDIAEKLRIFVGQSMLSHAFSALALSPIFAQALPEPPAIFYGTVTPAPESNPELDPLAFEITGNSESVTSPAQIITVGEQTFYLVKVPFETRSVVGESPLTPTPNTLELKAAPTTYTRTASINDIVASLPDGKESFTYGVTTQGLMERLDLTLIETFAQWSMRIFGTLVAPGDDEDGDGVSNYDEYLLGTNPQSASSNSILTQFTATPSGGFTFTWDSVKGHHYTIQSSSTLVSTNWQNEGETLKGTGDPLQYTHPSSTLPRLFFRIQVTEAE